MPISLPNSATGPVINTGGFSASVQQGSQVFFAIGSQPIGYIQRVDEADSYGAQGFYGLGNIEPFEIQDMQFSGQLTVTGGRLYKVGWNSQLFNGGAAQILTSGALNIVVYNLVTSAPDITYVGCVAQSYSMNYSANAYSIQTANFMYRTIQQAA